MEHPNAALIRSLYDARARNDQNAVRCVLSGEVIWHEPDVGGEHTGDLRGPDAVLAMMGTPAPVAGAPSASGRVRSWPTASTPWPSSTGRPNATA